MPAMLLLAAAASSAAAERTSSSQACMSDKAWAACRSSSSVSEFGQHVCYKKGKAQQSQTPATWRLQLG
jgi:hypothetical protein